VNSESAGGGLYEIRKASSEWQRWQWCTLFWNAVKLTNVVLAGFRKRGKLARKAYMFIKDKAEVASKVRSSVCPLQNRSMNTKPR